MRPWPRSGCEEAVLGLERSSSSVRCLRCDSDALTEVDASGLLLGDLEARAFRMVCWGAAPMDRAPLWWAWKVSGRNGVVAEGFGGVEACAEAWTLLDNSGNFCIASRSSSSTWEAPFVFMGSRCRL